MKAMAAKALIADYRWVLGDRIQHGRGLAGQDRRQEAEVARDGNEIRAGEGKQEAYESQPPHRAAFSDIEAGETKQH